MSKKLTALALVLCLMAAFAACGKKNDEKPTEAPSATATPTDATQPTDAPTPTEDAKPAYANAVAVLDAVWSTLSDDEGFAAVGGSFMNPVDNAPGAIDLAEKDTFTNNLLIPADVQDKLVDVASLTHMMNANTYTSAAIKVDGMDAKTVASKIEASFLGTQFVCGIPDKIAIASVDGYVVYAFGAADLVDDMMKRYVALNGGALLADKNFEN